MSLTPFFEPIRERSLRIDTGTEEEIRHEVMFESDVNAIHHRPLFVGSAFQKKRFIAALILLFISCSFLIGRAAWMQVGQGDKYLSLADSNRLRQIPLWPLRGIIHDRHGAILAENAPRFQVTVLPRDVPSDPGEREAIVGEASRLLGKSYTEVRAIISTTSTPDETVILSDSVPYAQAIRFAVALPHLLGFHLEARPMRHYPWSEEIESLSHVIGYVGKLSQQEYETNKDQGYRRADEIGKTGLERSYETVLRGKLGSRLNEVDARGRVN